MVRLFLFGRIMYQTTVLLLSKTTIKMEEQEINLSTKSKTLREKAGSFVTSPFFIIEVIVISSFLMLWLGGPGFIIGLAIALITLWAIKWDWAYFGLGDIKWISSIIPSLGYTLMIILLNDILLEPWVEIITQKAVDLSSFSSLHNNITRLLFVLTLTWIVAGFGEEFFYRGYIMNRIAHLLGNNNKAWIIATILSSLVFGIVHAYQGISGMITTGVVGLILALAFYKNKNNLWVGILTHGIYDTYGLTMIYLGNERIVKDTMIEIYHTIIL